MHGSWASAVDLLYLAHRIPYPPDKGDKIRSWNQLAFLAERARVHLGCFVDDPADMQHLGYLEEICAEVKALPLNPTRARFFALRGLLTGQPLTLPYYADAEMAEWVRTVLQEHPIAAQVVFSGAMAQFVDWQGPRPVFLDLVDVDSDKWTQYADGRSGPAAWIYRREGRRLAEVEADFAARADVTALVSEPEAALFRARAGLAEDRVIALGNGVDTDWFAPDAPGPDEAMAPRSLVFTGAMDYWPNVDAALWFAADILPLIRQSVPDAHFYIVGGNPDPRLSALAADPAVTVTGRVPETRRYIAAATVSVAPLRIARGIQNKVLEAMACRRAVVATPQAFEGIEAEPGVHLVVADGARETAEAVIALFGDAERREKLGDAARRLVQARYRWAARLEPLARALNLAPGNAPSATTAAS